VVVGLVTTTEHLDRIERDGFTIVHDAIDADLVGTLRETLDRLEHDLGIVPATNSFEGAATWRIYNLLAHGPVFEQVPVHPTCFPSWRACSTPVAW
jgi:hypothetical protein